VDAEEDSGCGNILGSDPANCGACGHDCQGQACKAGTCASTILAANEKWPDVMTIDGSSVYWNNEGGPLRACALDGTNLRSLTKDAGGVGTAIAVDSTHVYWGVEEGLLARCPLSGCGTSPDVLATGIGPRGMTLDATNLWWTNDTDGSITRCPLAGCSGNGTVLYSSPQKPGQLAMYGGWFYWTVFNNQGKGAVGACDMADCTGTATLFATGLELPFGIAADASGVYWAELGQGSNSRVMRAPLHGGAATVLASGQSSSALVAVDATSVYWTNEGGSVAKCAKAGCNGKPVVLAHFTAGTPFGIAVDDKSVYWTESGNLGAVLKAPK